MKSDNVTVDTMLYSIPVKRQKTSEDVEELPSGVEERLHNIESHLHLNGTIVHPPCLLTFLAATNENLFVSGESL